jgi:hypothetical protein
MRQTTRSGELLLRALGIRPTEARRIVRADLPALTTCD